MKIKREIVFFYFTLYLTLLVSLFFQENTVGGAEYDFSITSKVIKNFSSNFSYTLKNFSSFEISHFPFYYIFLSFFYNDYFNFFLIKILVLHLSLFLPLVFYKLIKLKHKYQNKYLIYIPGILFLSPSFRSSAVWAMNDNIALIFFSLSILFFNKYLEEENYRKKIIFILLNVLFLALSSYIRQYYAIFSIFFFYYFIKHNNLNLFLIYIFTNIILSLPALSLFNSGSNFTYSLNFISTNLVNNLIFTLNIFFIYLIPIYVEKKNIKHFFNFYNEKKVIAILIFVLTISLIFFIDYDLKYGGGIIFKLYLNSKTKYLFYCITYVSLLFIFHFTYLNYKNNLIIILCLLIMFPLYTVYQKYLDPLAIILIFCLFQNSMVLNFIKNLKVNIKFLYLYFFLIYIGFLSYRIIV